MSYLRGDAYRWFAPDETDDGTVPYWDGDFVLFVQELRANFGPVDPVSDAENKISYLRMKPTERVIKYMIRFNRLASQLSWGDSALRHQFYRGLPDRIKDELSRMPYEKTLAGTRIAAQSADQRYWARELERRRESHDHDHPKSSGKTKAKSSDSKPSGSSGSKPKPTASSSRNTESSSSSSKPRPAYASKLGPDGKITPAEKERRRKENLCMYCGGKGHVAADCKKRPAEASGKAGKAEATSTPKESKK